MRQAINIDLNDNLALNAARLSFDTKLAMADSIILATTQHYNATLWTQDAHFEGKANVRFIQKFS